MSLVYHHSERGGRVHVVPDGVRVDTDPAALQHAEARGHGLDHTQVQLLSAQRVGPIYLQARNKCLNLTEAFLHITGW